MTTLDVYATKKQDARKTLEKVIQSGYELDYESVTEADSEVYNNFCSRVKKITRQDHIGEMKAKMTGSVPLYKIPSEYLKKVVQKIKSFNKTQPVISDNNYDIDNFLEIHIEEIIRRNFRLIFPDLEIIDKGDHYFTSDGNFIDILAKSKIDNTLYVIELKRNKSPQKAIVQLLDYINQVSKNFNDNSIKGILLCREIDRRTKSAYETLRENFKEPSKISLREFKLIFSIK